MELKTEQCEACRPGSPMVTPTEEEEFRTQVPGWDIVEVKGVRRLKRTFNVTGWMPGVEFANAVAAMAEEEDHHPTITIAWGKVTISWWTHAIHGLHRNDFIMAARTDQAFSDQLG